MIKTLMHIAFGFLTGGLWFVYLIVRFITK